MDLHLKQWRVQKQHESEQQPSAKIPKLLLDKLDPHSHHHQPSALPLFVPEPEPEPNSKVSSSNLSANPDHSTNPRFPRMGSYFSLGQWQELELQALIYRYMLAGATVPPELLQPIKKSLAHSPTYFLHHPLQHYSHYQPALLQSGYWGRAAMDPEPGRCRRTDGKKWRCSRDVVAGQKYCERHMHRGRNRSRKPVEMPPTSTTNNTTITNMIAPGSGGGAIGCGALKASSQVTASPLAAAAAAAAAANGPSSFGGLSGPSTPIDLLHLNHSYSNHRNEDKGLFQAQNDGRVLRHFFDDWPRSLHEPTSDNAGISTTSLSISMPGNSFSSDVSLKLSTGTGDQLGSGDSKKDHQPQFNWSAGWTPNHVASMGGPLAKALGSSTTNSSPTSVLHRLPRAEATYVST